MFTVCRVGLLSLLCVVSPAFGNSGSRSELSDVSSDADSGTIGTSAAVATTSDLPTTTTNTLTGMLPTTTTTAPTGVSFPTGAPGEIFAITSTDILASNIAISGSPEASRSVDLAIGGVDWSETWCDNEPGVRVVSAESWSYVDGVVSQINSLIGQSITCTDKILTLTFLQDDSFFIKWNDTITFTFSGQFALNMAGVTEPNFDITFVADQPGAYPPTDAPTTPTPQVTSPQADLSSGQGPQGPLTTLNMTDDGEEMDSPNSTVPEGTIPWSLYNAASAIATVSALGTSAAIGGPFSASVLRGALITPQSCNGATNKTKLPFALHPTQVDLGMGGNLSQFASAALMNTILILGVLVLHAIAAGAAFGKTKNVIKAFGLVAFPGSVSFAGLQLLGPGVVGGAATLAVSSDPTVDGTATAIGMVCCVFVLLCYVVCLAGLTKFFFARGIPCGKVKVPWIFAPTVLYGDRSKRRRGYVDAFGRMFVSYSYKRQWFPVIDGFVLCIQMGLLANRPALDICDEQLWIPLVISQVLFLFLVLVLDPLQNFFDRMTCFLLTALVAAGGIAGAALDWENDGVGWATAIDRVGVAIAFLSFCYCCAAVGLAILRKKRGVRFRAPDCDSDDDSDDEVMAERARKKAEAEGVLGGKVDPSVAKFADDPGAEQKDIQQPLLQDLHCNFEETDPEIAMILLRGQWIRLKDPSTGAPYYYNVETEQTSWDLRASLGLGALKGAFGQFGAAGLSSDENEDSRWRRRQRRKEKERERRRKKKNKKKKMDPVKQALKDGIWKEMKDESSGKVYYHNPTTNKTSWDLYAEMGVEKPVDKVAEALEKGEWKEVKDPTTGNVYYHNPATNETTWNLKEKLGVKSDDDESESSSSSSSGFSTSDSDASPTRRSGPSLDTLTSLLAVTTPQMSGTTSSTTNRNPVSTQSNARAHRSELVERALAGGEWLELKDPNTGTVFYYNTKTQQTTNDLHAYLADLGVGEWIPIPDPNNSGASLLLNTVTRAVRSDPKSTATTLGGGASPWSTGARLSSPIHQGSHMGSSGLPDLKSRLTRRQRKKIKKLLRRGTWVMFVDPVTKMPCYRHAATGRISFDLVKEIGSVGDGYESSARSSTRRRGPSDVGSHTPSRRRRGDNHRRRRLVYSSEEDDLYEKTSRASRHQSGFSSTNTGFTGSNFSEAGYSTVGGHYSVGAGTGGYSGWRSNRTAGEIQRQKDQELYDCL